MDRKVKEVKDISAFGMHANLKRGSKAKKGPWKGRLGLVDKSYQTPFGCTNNSSIGKNTSVNVPFQIFAQKSKASFGYQMSNRVGSKAKKRQQKRLSDKDNHTTFHCTKNNSIGKNSLNVPSQKSKATFGDQVSNGVVQACTYSEDVNIMVEKRRLILPDKIELEGCAPLNGFGKRRLALPDSNEVEEAVSTGLCHKQILYKSNTAVPPSDVPQVLSTVSVLNGIALNGDTKRQKLSSEVAAEFQVANQTESLEVQPPLSYGPTEPSCIPARHVWSGCFDVCNVKHGQFTAHKSSGAHFKVDDAVKKFVPVLHMEKLSRLDAWPDRFTASPPTDVDIALFFFPSDERSGPIIDKLLEDIICRDFMLKYTLDDAELLVFASIHLPEQFHRIDSKLYFWGAFRKREFPITIGSSGSYQPLEGPSHAGHVTTLFIEQSKKLLRSPCNQADCQLHYATDQNIEEKHVTDSIAHSKSCTLLTTCIQGVGRSAGEGERVFDKHTIIEPTQQKVIEKQTIIESTHPKKVEIKNAECIESLRRQVSLATTVAKYYLQLKDLVKRKKNMRKTLILEERLQKGS